MAKRLLRQGDFGIVAEREQGVAGGSHGSIPGTGSSVMPAACLHFAQALGGGGQAVICNAPAPLGFILLSCLPQPSFYYYLFPSNLLSTSRR